MNYWNGEHHEGRGAPFTLTNPATGEATGTYHLASAEDVDEAVAAAKAAYPGFKALTPGERADLLLKLADELEARSEELASLESQQTGKSIRLATDFDVPGSIDNTRFFAGAARQLTGLSAGTYWEKSTSMTRREPLASSARSPRGTIRRRWRHGRSCPPSRPATRSCSRPRR